MQPPPLSETAAGTAFLSPKANALAAVDAKYPVTSGEKPVCRADLGRDDLTGLSLGQYDLGRRLGAGGMGLVYEARHRHLGKSVAIKFIRNEVNGEEATSRFLREIRTLGTLQHANIINAVDAGVEQRLPYCVTELLDGHDLGTWIELCGPLPLYAAAEVIRQAAEGLQFAHASGIVHRDIKPSNLFLQFNGTVKLLDFGLSLSEGNTNGATEPGRVLGTVDFMSPEQVQDAHLVTTSSDLYSLGASLFYLLTGRLLYDNERYPSTVNKLRAIGTSTEHLLHDSRCSLPVIVKPLLAQLLAPNPTDRLSSAAQVSAQLRAWASTESLAAWQKGHVAGTPHVAPEKTVGWLRKPLYLAIGAAVPAAAICVGLTLTKFANVPEPNPGYRTPLVAAANTTQNTPDAMVDRLPSAVAEAIAVDAVAPSQTEPPLAGTSQPIVRQTVNGSGRTPLSAGAIDFSAATSMKRAARTRLSTQSHSTQIQSP